MGDVRERVLSFKFQVLSFKSSDYLQPTTKIKRKRGTNRCPASVFNSKADYSAYS